MREREEHDIPPPRSHRDDPETSVEAAASVAPKQRTMHQRILGMFELFPGGLTDDALVALYEEAHGKHAYSTIRTRRGELCQWGSLRDSGRRVPKWEGSNRKVAVWELSR